MVTIDGFISMYSTSIVREYCEGLDSLQITIVIIIQ
jgi:hypothetical protein